MSCEDIVDRLDDLLEGALAGRELDEMRDHLAHCAPCRQELAAVEKLRRLTAGLPRGVEPGRDLWPGIEGRLRGERRRVFDPRRLPGPLLAAAALLLLALAAGLAYWAGRAQSPSRVVAAPAAGDVVLAAGPSPALGAAEAEMLHAREQLRAVVAARRDELSPETVRIVDENLRLIDDAIGRITAAVQEDPGNPELTRLLVAAYRQQIDLLQRVAQLPAAA